MAQYKVPQDVEADDKLIGPFTFRQFVYLLVAAGLIALAVVLFRIFPLLVLIPAPVIVFLLLLALPLKKDQPMEVYLAAKISFFLKSRKRIWTPGQKESSIQITAPKIVTENLTRDISGEEATHRLSFLADIVDSGGYSIKGINASPMRDDFAAEANAATDIFENNRFDRINAAMKKDENERHKEVVKEMHEAIRKNEDRTIESAKVIKHSERQFAQPSKLQTQITQPQQITQQPQTQQKPAQITDSKTVVKPQEQPRIKELSRNKDFSVATIAKQANRIRKEDGEVYISLH